MWQDLIEQKYLEFPNKQKALSAAQNIIDNKIGLVFKDKTFVGVVTKKALLAAANTKPEEAVEKLSIKVPIVTKNLSEIEVARAFFESGLHKIVIFDKKKPIGVLDRVKFLKGVVAPVIGKTLIEDVATRELITVRPDDLLSVALSKFKEHHVSKLVVFDTQLRGVISHTIILNYYNNNKKSISKDYKEAVVKSIMKTDVYTIGAHETLAKAIEVFDKSNSSSLIVLGKGGIFSKGNMYGIITKTDILSRFIAEFKDSKLQVNVSSKIDDIDKELVLKKISSLDRVLDKDTNVFVNIKQGKEKFRGLPLISLRVRVVTPKKSESLHVEGWGLDHSLELVVSKLKRRLTEIESH